MGLLDALGIVGGLASIAGLVAAFYFARRDRRVRLLTYSTSVPVALASAISPKDEDFDLTVVFKPKGGRQTRLQSVNVRFLRFANLGREPVRREDIAASNPLRVVVEGVRALEISLAGVSREVANIGIANETYSDDQSSAEIQFAFLDHNDGGVIKLITVGGQGKVCLKGDIIGMPEGIRRSDQLRALGLLNAVGCTFAALLELAALSSVPFIFYWVTGTWTHVWLLGLPFVAFFVPGILIALVASTLWPDPEPTFPKSLTLPDWARRLEFLQFRAYEGTHDPRVLIELPPRLEERITHEKT